jgi:hypothetical protein
VRAVKSVQIGRNDPCSCGSGQKYKRCCAAKDAAARSAELSAQQAARAAALAAEAEAQANSEEDAEKPKPAKRSKPPSGKAYAPKRGLESTNRGR